MSPGSRCAASASSTESTTPAGSINQIARGLLSLATSSASDACGDRAFAVKAFCSRCLRVMHDADVVFPEQAPHHARAHSTQTDHPELHRCFSGGCLPLGASDCVAPRGTAAWPAPTNWTANGCGGSAIAHPAYAAKDDTIELAKLIGTP